MRYFGDPVLRKTAKPVEIFDDKLAGFVHELIETMEVEDGVGLASPQVGVSIRLAVIDASGGEKEPYVLINPEITFLSEETIEDEEGCLSLPDINVNITRPVRVSVSAFDEFGRPYTIENVEGLLARALQHEIDHLNGIMIVDHVSPIQRQLLNSKLKKISKNGRDKSKAA